MVDQDQPPKRPSQFERHKELERNFLVEVGACILAWSDIESVLFSVVHHCLGGDIHNSALVFRQAQVIARKLKLADDLLGHKMRPLPMPVDPRNEPPAWLEWRSCKAEAERLCTVRAVIAHQPMKTINDDGGEARGFGGITAWGPNSRPAIVAEHIDGLTRREGYERPMLEITDLKAHKKAVRDLFRQMERFLTSQKIRLL